MRLYKNIFTLKSAFRPRTFYSTVHQALALLYFNFTISDTVMKFIRCQFSLPLVFQSPVHRILVLGQNPIPRLFLGNSQRSHFTPSGPSLKDKTSLLASYLTVKLFQLIYPFSCITNTSSQKPSSLRAPGGYFTMG